MGKNVEDTDENGSEAEDLQYVFLFNISQIKEKACY